MCYSITYCLGTGSTDNPVPTQKQSADLERSVAVRQLLLVRTAPADSQRTGGGCHLPTRLTAPVAYSNLQQCLCPVSQNCSHTSYLHVTQLVITSVTCTKFEKKLVFLLEETDHATRYEVLLYSPFIFGHLL